ncbi:protein mono-ADP-ribosyltransferase PARP12-like [Diabrotica undecimpunctata]|uniref:protein mono-ADP-ribosyltransferase PARP12-like n=1 Tax=Diabrotica undecimpunctata TaxID=50387 RepID=UPI003B63A5F1
MGNCCCGDIDNTYDEPIRSTRSSVPSSIVITTPPTLNLSNDRASIRPNAVTRNTTRTPGYDSTSSKTNRETSRTRRDNNKTLAPSRGHLISSKIINQHSTINTNRTTLVPVREDPEIVTQLLNNFCNFYINLTHDVFQLETLREESLEYQRIKSIFFQSNKSFFKLHSIEKVHNPYLLIQYGLKKYEYTRKGISYSERLLFHGTKKANIDNICRNNFNWRLKGTAVGSRFGQGVCFASVAYFSTHYCDEGYNKVMIIAKVLISNSCRGNTDMAIPPYNFDTSTDDKQNVYVKYNDNTFYPTYLIHFGGIDYKKKYRPSISD